MFKNSKMDSVMDVFLNLLMLLSVGSLAASIQNLWARYIDLLVHYSEPLGQGRYYFSNDFLTYPVAILIIATPLLISLLWLQNSRLHTDPDLKNTGSTHATDFLVLLGSTVAGLSYLVYTLWRLLGGNITLEVPLKLITALIISGSIFVYYLSKTKNDDVFPSKKQLKVVSAAIITTSVITLIIGFLVMDYNRQRDREGRIIPPPAPIASPNPTKEPEEKILVQKLTEDPNATVSAQTIDMWIEDANVFKNKQELYLEISVVLEGNEYCPASGSAICQAYANNVSAVDSEGFKLSPLIKHNKESLGSTQLLKGEKVRGNVYFTLEQPTDEYLVYYTETKTDEKNPKLIKYHSEKIMLQMEDAQ